MAITTTITQLCKKNLLDGVHLAADTYRLALGKATLAGTYDKTTDSYDTLVSGTDEHAAAGNYATGGVALTRIATVKGDTVNLDFDDAVWATATISSPGGVCYDDTATGNPALLWQDFGGTKTSTGAEFRVAIANLIALSGA